MVYVVHEEIRYEGNVSHMGNWVFVPSNGILMFIYVSVITN